MSADICQKTSKNRMLWIDSLKAIAVSWIFLTHFIQSSFLNWGINFSWGTIGSKILYGISGKYAVSFFCVFLGYLAAQSKNKSIVDRIVHRYLQFCIPLLLVSSLQYVIYYFQNSVSKRDVFLIPSISFLFESNMLCAQAWCISFFFSASVIIYLLNEKKHRILFMLFLSVLFLFYQRLWISICLFGAIIYHVSQLSFFKNFIKQMSKNKLLFSALKICLLVVAYLIIRFPENDTTYLLDGVSASIILLVCLYSPLIQKILSFPSLLHKTGFISFEIFLLHPMFYCLTNNLIFSRIKYDPNSRLTFLFAFVFAYLTVWLFAYLMSKLLKSKYIKKIYSFVDQIIPNLS